MRFPTYQTPKVHRLHQFCCCRRKIEKTRRETNAIREKYKKREPLARLRLCVWLSVVVLSRPTENQRFERTTRRFGGRIVRYHYPRRITPLLFLSLSTQKTVSRSSHTQKQMERKQPRKRENEGRAQYGCRPKIHNSLSVKKAPHLKETE